MNTYLKSTGLVMVLTGLLVLPTLSFGFIGEEPEAPVVAHVLGVSTVPSTNVAKSESSLQIVDQIDMTANSNSESSQKFYNVIPEKYLTDDYSILLVVSKEIKSSNNYFKLNRNDSSADLVVTLSDKTLNGSKVPVTFLIFSK